MKSKTINDDDPKDIPTIVLSCVDRPINLLSDDFSRSAKLDPHTTYEDIIWRCRSEQLAYLPHAKGRMLLSMLPGALLIIVISSLLSLSAMGVARFDFNQVNPTWLMMVTSELAICPSLTVLMWKIRYQIKADRSLLFRNMASFSLELKEGDIKRGATDFRKKCERWLDCNQFSTSSAPIGNNKYLGSIERGRNIRLVFHELSREQAKVMSPLSENLAVEIAVFATTLISSIVTMAGNLMSVKELTAHVIIQDVATLALSFALAFLLGFFIARRSLKKATSLTVIRNLLHSYLTDAK